MCRTPAKNFGHLIKQNHQVKLHNPSISDTFSMPLASTRYQPLALREPCFKLFSAIPRRKHPNSLHYYMESTRKHVGRAWVCCNEPARLRLECCYQGLRQSSLASLSYHSETKPFQMAQLGLVITGGPAFSLAGMGGGLASAACITTGAMTLGLDGMGGAWGKPGGGPVGGAVCGGGASAG